MSKLRYQSGFRNIFETEAERGTLPRRQNSPQQVAKGLYAEQLSGSAFTAPSHENLRSWLYRIRPGVVQGAFKARAAADIYTGGHVDEAPNPTPMRWGALPYPNGKVDFLTGLKTYAVNGCAHMQAGMAAHLYACTASMKNEFFYNSDGEMLFVPQEGRLLLRSELGHLEVAPNEIAVMPRGVKFQVQLLDARARGYVCENYGTPFRPPERGVIGANGLADPRHFLYPVAAFENKRGSFTLVTKFQGRLWEAALGHSPLDVVAWHGNYAPYKYDLANYNVINTVSFDHPDPSIFTVLTSPSQTPGVANADFVIFPPRWMVAEHTFRPPYYHRNCMSEFMGLILGAYDAKEEGFVPGGASLHNAMSAHGPDTEGFAKGSTAELTPQKYEGTQAIMFESRYAFIPTPFAAKAKWLDKNYLDCWQGLGALYPAGAKKLSSARKKSSR